MKRVADQGVALVEFAIVVPLLLIMVFGAMDVGRLYFEQVALADAAQEGAFYSSFEPDDHTKTTTRVVESLNDPAVTAADVTVLCPGGVRIIVSVEKEVQHLSPFFTPFWGSSTTLRRTVEAEVHSTATCDPTP